MGKAVDRVVCIHILGLVVLCWSHNSCGPDNKVLMHNVTTADE